MVYGVTFKREGTVPRRGKPFAIVGGIYGEGGVIYQGVSIKIGRKPIPTFIQVASAYAVISQEYYGENSVVLYSLRDGEIRSPAPRHYAINPDAPSGNLQTTLSQLVQQIAVKIQGGLVLANFKPELVSGAEYDIEGPFHSMAFYELAKLNEFAALPEIDIDSIENLRARIRQAWNLGKLSPMEPQPEAQPLEEVPLEQLIQQLPEPGRQRVRAMVEEELRQAQQNL